MEVEEEKNPNSDDHQNQQSHKFGEQMLPKQFENTYNVKPLQQKQSAEKILDSDIGDRRNPNFNPGIYGQLRMQFGNKYYVGSGTVIGINEKKEYIIITAAHNIIDYDRIDKKEIYADNAWFYCKNINGVTFWSAKISSGTVHPSYDPTPGEDWLHDLAVLTAKIDYQQSTNMHQHRIALSGANYCPKGFFITGYPAEKRGELWQGNGTKVTKCKKEGIIYYEDIDTTGGQSGSPIWTQFPDCQPEHIHGVHTGGSAASGKNWGTWFSKDKIEWIAKFLSGQPSSINEWGDLLLPPIEVPANPNKVIYIVDRTEYPLKHW